MVARRRRDFVCFEPRTYLRHGRILAHEGETGGGATRNSLRRNDLEGAAGFFAGWNEDRLQLVPRPAMASALAAAGEWRRRVSDIVRRLGRDICAMVSGRRATGIYFEPKREHGIVAATDPRRDAAETGGDRAQVFAAARPGTTANFEPRGRNYGSAGLGHRQDRALLRAGGCLDQWGHWIRSGRTAFRGALFSVDRVGRNCRSRRSSEHRRDKGV